MPCVQVSDRLRLPSSTANVPLGEIVVNGGLRGFHRYDHRIRLPIPLTLAEMLQQDFMLPLCLRIYTLAFTLHSPLDNLVQQAMPNANLNVKSGDEATSLRRRKFPE